MAAVFESTGGTIAEDLAPNEIPEFVLKDDVEWTNYLLVLERISVI